MSEIMNIPLGGVSNEPNDYSSEDGALSLSLNAVKHHGSIRPVMPGSPVADIGEDGLLLERTDVVAIHEVGGMKHYIVVEEVEEEAGSVIRPEDQEITIYYICEGNCINIWWDSNIAKEGMTLYLMVGEGKWSKELEIKYGSKKTIPSADIAVAAITNADGTTEYVMYDYFDESKHISKDCLEILRLVTSSGIIVGQAVPDDNKYYKDARTVINLTAQCFSDHIRIGFGCKGKDVDHIRMDIGWKRYSQSFVVKLGEVVDYTETEGLIVGYRPGTDTVAEAVVYNYPDQLLLASCVHVYEVRDTEGNIIPWEEVKVNINITAPEGEEEIDTKKELFGDSEEPGRYRLYYIDANAEKKDKVAITSAHEAIAGVYAIGNALAVMRKNRPLLYAIWKDGRYQVLGSQLPELNCKANLRTQVYTAAGINNVLGVSFSEGGLNLYDKDKPELSGAVASSVDNDVPYTAEMQAFVYDKVFSVVNSTHNAMTREGLFYAPFYVRMAYRMYDGKHVMHTPPKLMIANSAGHPFIKLEKKTTSDNKVCASMVPYFPCSTLDIEFPPVDSKWEDLITSIDIFVTPPIIGYTDSPESIAGTKEVMRDYAVAQESKEAMRSALDLGVGLDAEQKVVISDIIAYKDVWYRLPKNMVAASQAYIIPEKRDDFDIEKTLENQEFLWDKDEKIADGLKLGDLNLPSWLKKKLDDGKKVRAFPSTSETKFEYNSTTNHVTFIGIFDSNLIEPVIGENENKARIIQFRRADSTSYETNLLEENRFYCIKSIPFAEAKNGWSEDVLDKEHTLDYLEQNQHVTDNGQSRSVATTDIPPMVYNSRLSVVVKGLGLPTSPDIDYFTSPPFNGKDTEETAEMLITRAWIKGIVNTQTIYAEIPVADNAYADRMRQFYYPDYNATQLILTTANLGKGTYSVLVYNLEKHKLLNGTYLFNSFDVVPPAESTDYPSDAELLNSPYLKDAMEGATEAIYGNMVRVSGVSNPFYFNEVNQVQLPSGKISGLSTTAKALSQGQFGAFPLYCFSDNGIWALEVSDTGTYSAKQPVSRAVCTNPESITQTEGQVLFVTKRGLMALDGSSVTCVSEALSGHNYTSALSKLDKVKELAGLKDVPNPDTHIEEWLQNARLLYDDKRQMIYAFNDEPKDVLGYVYSISDQAWGMMVHDLAHPLPCYTDALAVTRENGNGRRRLVNMSDHTGCGEAPKAVLVTRPLTFGSADAFKSIEALTLRGMLDKDDAKLVVWASNDLKHWAVAASSQTSWYRGKSGTPYKYYRIGIVLEWEEEDSLNAIGADITTRLTNRIR